MCEELQNLGDIAPLPNLVLIMCDGVKGRGLPVHVLSPQCRYLLPPDAILVLKDFHLERQHSSACEVWQICAENNWHGITAAIIFCLQ